MNIRYYCEHEAFRKIYDNDPIKVISKLLTEKEKYIYDLFLKIYDDKHEAFPYQQKDFKVEVSSKDQLEYIIITMPEAFIEPTLCHKIILAYCMNLDLYEYFTIEDGNDKLFGKYKVLCAWIEGSHVAFTNYNDNDSLEDAIYNIAMI